MKRYLVLTVLVAVMLALMLPMTTGLVSGKGHVPAGKVQVSHKGRVAITVSASALEVHLKHGDIQLPVCDFDNVFHSGDDTSDVLRSDSSGVTYTSGFVARNQASTTACPSGTF